MEEKMFGIKWIEKGMEILNKIKETQIENMKKAAEVMTKSILAERWVHCFGVGHAIIPVQEIYPRIGGFVGFHPITELSLSYFSHVVGDQGVRQFLFLERLEGFGKVILKNYRLDPKDTMWIFSFSGINPVIIDVALESKRQGLTVVATTSLEHSKITPSRHSSGKRLFEIADIVIDCCVPAGDAMIEIEGLDEKVGPGSSLAFISIVNCVVTQVAYNMVKAGTKPLINPTVNVKDNIPADQIIENNLKEYERRLYNIK